MDDDPFDFQALRILQPGRWLPTRASYEIFSEERQLLAIVTETEAHARLNLLNKPMPDARVLAVTTPANEPVLTLVKHRKERVTELHTPQGELAETGRSVWLGGDYWGTQEAAMQAVVS